MTLPTPPVIFCLPAPLLWLALSRCFDGGSGSGGRCRCRRRRRICKTWLEVLIKGSKTPLSFLPSLPSAPRRTTTEAERTADRGPTEIGMRRARPLAEQLQLRLPLSRSFGQVVVFWFGAGEDIRCWGGREGGRLRIRRRRQTNGQTDGWHMMHKLPLGLRSYWFSTGLSE